MRIHLDLQIGRRELRVLPLVVATIVALVFVEWPVTIFAPVIVLAAWALTALAIAIIDELVTQWKHERSLAASIEKHPSRFRLPKSPRHRRGRLVIPGGWGNDRFTPDAA